MDVPVVLRFLTQRCLRPFSRLPRSGKIVFCLAALAVIGFFDYLTGTDVAFWTFYFIPISIAAWYLGPSEGLAFSVLSLAIWVVVDVLTADVRLSPLVNIWNGLVRLGSFFVVSVTMSALNHVLETERRRSRLDSLTGIANRRAFFENLRIEMLRSRRSHRPITVAYVDLDRFKSVNDRFGHAAGDEVLITVARTIKGNLRATDTVARLGGDEFAIIVADASTAVAQKVLRKIEISLQGSAQSHGWDIGASMGAVTFIEAPESVDQMVTEADRLMYAVKKSGNGTFRHEVRNPKPLSEFETILLRELSGAEP